MEDGEEVCSVVSRKTTVERAECSARALRGMEDVMLMLVLALAVLPEVSVIEW